MDKEKPYAYTGYFPIFKNRIVSEAYLKSPCPEQTRSVKIKAVWDTGAAHCVVSPQLADFLDLPNKGIVRVEAGFDTKRECQLVETEIYIVLGAAKIRATAFISDESMKDYDMIVGMSVIQQGDFAFTHSGKQPVFSFCFPPIGVETDYTKLAPRMRPGTKTLVVDDSDPELDKSKRFRNLYDNAVREIYDRELKKKLKKK